MGKGTRQNSGVPSVLRESVLHGLMLGRPVMVLVAAPAYQWPIEERIDRCNVWSSSCWQGQCRSYLLPDRYGRNTCSTKQVFLQAVSALLIRHRDDIDIQLACRLRFLGSFQQDRVKMMDSECCGSPVEPNTAAPHAILPRVQHLIRDSGRALGWVSIKQQHLSTLRMNCRTMCGEAHLKWLTDLSLYLRRLQFGLSIFGDSFKGIAFQKIRGRGVNASCGTCSLAVRDSDRSIAFVVLPWVEFCGGTAVHCMPLG